MARTGAQAPRPGVVGTCLGLIETGVCDARDDRRSERSIDMTSLAILAATAAVLAAGSAQGAGASSIAFTTLTKSEGMTKSGFLLREDVLQNGRKVGTDVVRCRPVGQKVRCRVTVTLPRGTIVVTFTSAEGSSRGALRVVDGTGAYADATGGGLYRNLNPQGSRTAVTLRLR
jgi:hypothetical protein